MNIKRLFLITHRWFGIIAGFHLVLLGLSGSYLVYGDWFEKKIFSHRYELERKWNDTSVREVVEKTQNILKINNLPGTIVFPKNKNETIQVIYNHPTNEKPRNLVISFYDPVNNRFVDQVGFVDTWKGWLFIFHHDIFMGRTGHVLNGISGILCMILLLSGLYLWIPKAKNFKKALYYIRTKNVLTFTLDTHKIIGLYTLGLMLLVTFTGLYISMPSWFDFLPKDGQSRSRPDPVDFDVLNAFKSAEEKFGKEQGLVLRVHPRNRNLYVGSKGATYIFDGEAKTFSKMSSNGSTRKIMGDLHEGAFWGETGRALIFISGILPLFFYISGIYLWIRKSKFKIF